MVSRILLFVFVTSFVVAPCHPTQTVFAAELLGTLTGYIHDVDTREPLIGANIQVLDAHLGTTTDTNGKFYISSIPIGNHTLKCTYIGYEPVMVTDVIVKSRGQLPLKIEMRTSAINSSEVEIQANAFSTKEDVPVSVTTLSSEEIRRHPSSAGDISRIIAAQPGVAKSNNTQNALIVRGGSALENGFYLDGIPIPNINHFPAQGSSSGVFGLINVDGIEDVTFSPGGFPAQFGNKMSSITEISLREGNREHFAGQADLNMAGVGGVVEGPLPQDKGSWMVSAHRSYFDLILDLFVPNSADDPHYTDMLAKVNVDLSNRSRLTFLDVAAVDVERADKQKSLDDNNNEYGRADWKANTAGINWRYLWNAHGYSITTLSHNYTKWNNEWRSATTDKLFSTDAMNENHYTLRNQQHLLLNDHTTLDAGLEAVVYNAAYNNFWSDAYDSFGNLLPPFQVNKGLTTSRYAVFASLSREWFPRLSVTTGVRAEYNQYSARNSIAPRVQLAYRAGQQTTLNAAYGRVYQTLPMGLLVQDEDYKKLRDPYADHFIAGVSHLLSENTRFTLEAYAKEYRNLPLNPTQPSLFLMDQIGDLEAARTSLFDHGKAYTRGMEVMLQKKLVERIFGVISASAFRSRYQGYDGKWRNRVYDNLWSFTVEGGYKPNRDWEFGVRWVYAGGKPYTPFDEAASQALNEGIRDSTRVNAERIPDFHTLTLRVDKHFYFSASDLICYFNIWNAYNRDNISGYSWNTIEHRKKTKYQWGIMAVIGLEYEF